MTVEDLFVSGSLNEGKYAVKCVWFDRDFRIQKDTFKEETLEIT